MKVDSHSLARRFRRAECFIPGGNGGDFDGAGHGGSTIDADWYASLLKDEEAEEEERESAPARRSRKARSVSTRQLSLRGLRWAGTVAKSCTVAVVRGFRKSHSEWTKGERRLVSALPSPFACFRKPLRCTSISSLTVYTRPTSTGPAIFCLYLALSRSSPGEAAASTAPLVLRLNRQLSLYAETVNSISLSLDELRLIREPVDPGDACAKCGRRERSERGEPKLLGCSRCFGTTRK